MKRLFTTCILVLLVFCVNEVKAQIGINTMNPDTNAVLDIQSKDKGIKLPSIQNTAVLKVPQDSSGYIIYHSTDKKFRYWNTKIWESVNPFSADEKNENITAPKNLNVTGTAKANDFVGYGTIPMGGIIMWNGNEADVPTGWALCDGSWYNPDNNKDKGPANTTQRTIQTPNLSGKFIAGYSSSSPEYNTGSYSGGGDKILLSEENLPQHRHYAGKLVTSETGAHSHLLSSSGNRGPGGGGREPVNYQTTGVTQTVTSSDGKHQHAVTGYTSYAGGKYTYDSIPNPEKYLPKTECSIYQYICETVSKVKFLCNENLTDDYPLEVSGSQENLDWASGWTGYKITSKIPGYSTEYLRGYTENYFSPEVGGFCDNNPLYDVNNKLCINPLHDPDVPLKTLIHVKEKWDVKSIDNRPPYYVLAFIMRIK
jgi:hypothetical protein